MEEEIHPDTDHRIRDRSTKKTVLPRPSRLVHGELTPDRGSIDCAVVTRHFPCMPSDPAISTFDVAKDATGPFRRWEAEMAKLLDAASLDRFSTLQARLQEAGGYEIEAQVSRELGALDIGTALRHRPFRKLSDGERMRCLLTGLFARDEGFVLIDEPTNPLDRAGRARNRCVPQRQVGVPARIARPRIPQPLTGVTPHACLRPPVRTARRRNSR